MSYKISNENTDNHNIRLVIKKKNTIFHFFKEKNCKNTRLQYFFFILILRNYTQTASRMVFLISGNDNKAIGSTKKSPNSNTTKDQSVSKLGTDIIIIGSNTDSMTDNINTINMASSFIASPSLRSSSCPMGSSFDGSGSGNSFFLEHGLWKTNFMPVVLLKF